MERKHLHERGMKGEQPKRWSRKALQVKRSIRVPEATVTAGTLDPMPTGGHFTHIFFDDLVNPENSQNRDLIEKVITQFNYFYSIVTSPNQNIALEGPMFVSGTIYDKDDLNAKLKKDKEYKTLTIPCYLDQETAKALGKVYIKGVKVPTCPERFTVELLEKKRSRIGDYMFSCQYLLEPWDAKASLFKKEWLAQTYKSLPENIKFALVFDPAGHTKTNTGECTILIVAIDEKLNVYFYAANRGLFTAKEMGMIVNMQRKIIRGLFGSPPEVGMEKAGLQEAFKSVIEQESDESFVIYDLRHGNRHWFVRALPMATRAQNMQLYFPDPEIYPEEQWWADALKDQLLFTTKGQDKGERDWWDCAGYIDQMITKHHCRPPLTGDKAYTGTDGMEIDDDIIGY